LIQHAIETLSAGTYLEIGVDQGATFFVVQVARKIGVDPTAPRPNVEAELKRPGAQYFATTSDEFFERHAAEQLPLGVDVVFIDGPHTYDQTYRDVRNVLKVRAPAALTLAGGNRCA
jgi:Methyltransferase domain